MMTTIEHSPILLSCYMKSEIADLIIRTIQDEHRADLPLTVMVRSV